MILSFVFLIFLETRGVLSKEIDLPQVLSTRANLKSAEQKVENPFQNLLLSMIKLYQNSFSLVQSEVCNFTPSCSHFGYDAIKYHGLIKGLLLTSDRLQRCHSGAWKYINKYYTLKIDSLRGPKLYDPVERY